MTTAAQRASIRNRQLEDARLEKARTTAEVTRLIGDLDKARTAAAKAERVLAQLEGRPPRH